MSPLLGNLWPLARRALREQERILPWLGGTTTAPASDAGSARSEDGMYGGRYFGAGRRRDTRGGRSGYPTYDRKSSRAEVVAYLVWKHFAPANSLDVGCALGFAVEAQRELGIDAEGCDVSAFAVEHATPGARGHLVQARLDERLPFPDGRFELVTAFEVLEHLEPSAVPRALSELRRVARGHVVVTIPSFGENASGPAGILEGKVRGERLRHYRALGAEYRGPVPLEDLARDADGQPVEGHLTIASYRWWTEAFAAAGFERSEELERRLWPELYRFGRGGNWCLYVFSVPGAPLPAMRRTAEELEALERRWGLDALALAVSLQWHLGQAIGPALPLVQRLLRQHGARVSRWTAGLRGLVARARG